MNITPPLRSLTALLLGLGIALPAFCASVDLGTYQGSGCVGRDKLAAHEAWLGRKVERVLDGPAQDSWKTVVATTQWLAKCWQGTGKKLVYSLPMLTRDGTTTLAAGAQGAYDEHFREIARVLVAFGQADAVIRIAPEFNAPWFPWSATKDPAAWKAYWRHIVLAMREVPGTQFQFDWCAIVGAGAASPEPAYPGDDVVDIVGADAYNGNWNPTFTPEQRWQLLLNAPYGLQWHRRFAAAHGKPMSYPEWGTGSRPDGHGGGDDPLFVRSMAKWIASNPVSYHIYWDYKAPDYNGRLSDGSQPQAAAAFIDAFGGPR